MKVNVDKVLERDAKLSELDSRAGRLISKKSLYRTLCFYLFVRKVVVKKFLYSMSTLILYQFYTYL